jgi:hypothetical protein
MLAQISYGIDAAQQGHRQRPDQEESPQGIEPKMQRTDGVRPGNPASNLRPPISTGMATDQASSMAMVCEARPNAARTRLVVFIRQSPAPMIKVRTARMSWFMIYDRSVGRRILGRMRWLWGESRQGSCQCTFIMRSRYPSFLLRSNFCAKRGKSMGCRCLSAFAFFSTQCQRGSYDSFRNASAT